MGADQQILLSRQNSNEVWVKVNSAIYQKNKCQSWKSWPIKDEIIDDYRNLYIHGSNKEWAN